MLKSIKQKLLGHFISLLSADCICVYNLNYTKWVFDKDDASKRI